jgi:GDSL-like lipase/acylhydrolase family protein
MKELIIRLTLMSLVSIILLLALEFGLSKFAPNPKAFQVGELYARDEYIGWKGNPGKEGYYVKGRTAQYVKINSHGFKDKERTYEKGKDVFRIVVLGDSFTEALQVPVERTFPYVLEQRLNLENSKRFEVINLGVSGFGTAQEYLTLKYYGLKYHPDFVILAFLIANDVINNSLALETDKDRPFFVLSDGNLEQLPFKVKVSNPTEDKVEAKKDTAGQFQIKYLLLKYSTKFFPNIYYSLSDRIKQTPWLANFLWEIGIKKSKPELPDKYKNEFPISYHTYTAEYPPEWENAWKVTKALILKSAKELETDKIGFLVVVIPSELEFRPDIWKKILDDHPQMKAIKFDLKKPERILSNFFETNKIDYLLLRPELEKYTKETGNRLHFPYEYEHHWNAQGHALAAELIYEKLRDDKLIH